MAKNERLQAELEEKQASIAAMQQTQAENERRHAAQEEQMQRLNQQLGARAEDRNEPLEEALSESSQSPIARGSGYYKSPQRS